MIIIVKGFEMKASHMDTRVIAKDLIPTDGSAFLRKTYSILMNEQNHDIVNWSACGTKFSIIDHERFAAEILPKYFKHNNTKSFVRQLNIHGFKKFSPKAEKGKDYYNDYFKRGQPELLKHIERVSIKSREENFKRLNQLDDICANGICQPGKVFTVPCGTSSVEACAISIGTFSTDDGESSCKDMMPDADEAAALVQAMKIFSKYKRTQQDLGTTFMNPVERDIYFKTKELLTQIELLQNISVAAVHDSAVSRTSEGQIDQSSPFTQLKTTENPNPFASSMQVEFSEAKNTKKQFARQAESALKPLQRVQAPALVERKPTELEQSEECQPISLGKRQSAFSESLSVAAMDSEDEEPDTSSWFNTSYLYNTSPKDSECDSNSVFREFDLDMPDL